MANLNKVMLIGNLTRDPELSYTPRGSAVCDLSLAINRSWTDEHGEKKEEVTFVGVVLYGRLAEIAGEYLRKGRPVYIEGRLRQDSWEDRDTGKKQTKTRIVCESLQLLGGKESGDRAESAPAQSSRQPPVAPRETKRPARAGNSITHDDLADDVPF
jgi:single-strand DNA-binding protein